MRVLVALLILTGASAPATAAEWSRRDLRVPGSVLWLTSGDLDGDRRPDLIVSYRRGAGPATQRYLGVFLRRADGLPGRPDLLVRAPSNAAAFDVGDVDGDGDDDLVYLMASGVFAQALDGDRLGSLERVVASPTLVVVPEEEDLVAWDFLRRLSPDGPPTLVLPGRRRLRLFRRTDRGWKSDCAVRLRQWSYYDAESAHYRPSGRGGSSGRPYAFRVTTIVPNIDFADQTGDGAVDLITHYDDRVAVHRRTEGGCFAERPSYQHWFKVRTAQEQESRDNRVSGQVVDLDGDRVADFVVTKIGGGITTLKTEVRMYRGLKGGGFQSKPAQVFRDDGFAALVRFVDVDGDGRREMIHPHSEVSIVGMTRAMLSSSLGLDVRIRRADPKAGFFAREPSQVLDISIGLDLGSGASLRGTAPLFGYDLTGDGRLDVVVPDGGDTMLIHPGRTGADGFDTRRRTSLSAPGSNSTIVLPAGPGAPPELLVYYPYRKALSNQLVLFRRRNR